MITGGDFFPLFSFLTWDSGTRTANFTLKLLLDGAEQLVYSQNNASNSYAHIGTNTVNLATGLQFDEFSLQYRLISSDNVNNHPSSLLPWPGVGPEQNPYFVNQISYTDNPSQVPEPGSLALLGLGMTGLAFVRRRRNAAC